MTGIWEPVSVLGPMSVPDRIPISSHVHMITIKCRTALIYGISHVKKCKRALTHGKCQTKPEDLVLCKPINFFVSDTWSV